jgi:hypothetical protein
LAALVVAIAYLVIQQLESHILAPNIVGSSVGVHPLLVIFALLAGAQIGGVLGMLAALPILAMLKHTYTFYDLKLSKSTWVGEDGAVMVRITSGVPPPPLVSEVASSKGAGRRKKSVHEAVDSDKDEAQWPHSWFVEPLQCC